jgi:hypothetical protein
MCKIYKEESMVKRIIMGLCLIVMLLTACSSAAPTTGDLKDFGTVCDKANDGKRIAAVGYLRFPDSITGTDNVVLRLYNSSDFTGATIGVTVNFGTQPNQVELVQDQFKDSDLKVHLSNGQATIYGTKVKVSGDVYFPVVAQEFACGLDNPLVEGAN